ncbi:protoporphyrinogen oxidase-like [Nilaparvata lugens]|uniref:protoporphyrinogen oxidase-like n=1 Tax=Nilaparvata lugens TaxID=108931 RepID=UPI00193D2ECA|nr:protoporphyrinogen oxidase-like [Nilaparvata lugens]
MLVVLGGGIGGLSAAHYLVKRNNANSKILLVEATSYLGGWIKTIVNEDKGVIFETGPRTIRPAGHQGANTLLLIEELNLADKVKPILRSHPAAKNRFIYTNKKLHPLPSSLGSMFFAQPPFEKPLIMSIFKDLSTPMKKIQDESLYSFVERRLGKDIADYAISPMVCGICAGDAKEISVRFLMSSLFDAEQKHGSIIRGLLRNMFDSSSNPKIEGILSERAKKEKWSVWTMEGGLQTLPDKLSSKLADDGVDISLNEKCTSLKFVDGGVQCRIGSEDVHAKHVVSSIAANGLAKIIGDNFLSQELSEIECVTVGVVNLAFNGDLLKENGFGFLVPPFEGLPLLGIIFDSCCTQQSGKTVLTVMMGGRWFDKYFGKNPTKENLLDTAITQVKNILHINEQPILTNCAILENCIPQYVIGHHERVNRIQSYISDKKLPLSLVGSSYNGVGLNDVILSSRTAVDKIIL